MNEHNSIWSSDRNDFVGQQILNTCPTRPKRLMINIFFFSLQIFNITNWSVDLDTLDSNHFIIKIDIANWPLC